MEDWGAEGRKRAAEELFAGSHEAAKQATAIYSFFAMCKKEAVNPFDWPRYVFESIGDTKITQLKMLYPKRFMHPA